MAKQVRAEITRTQLVRSAAELFDRNGFAGTTLADVSRAAGVTKGAFYFHFTSKDALGGAVHGEACAMLRAAAHRIGAKRQLVQGLIDLTHEVAGWLECEPVVRASFRTARECGHRGAPYLEFYHEWQLTVEALALGAEQAGELRPDARVEDVTTLVLTVIAGVETLWWTGVRQGSVRTGLAGMWRLALPGIVPEDRLPELLPEGRDAAEGVPEQRDAVRR